MNAIMKYAEGAALQLFNTGIPTDLARIYKDCCSEEDNQRTVGMAAVQISLIHLARLVQAASAAGYRINADVATPTELEYLSLTDIKAFNLRGWGIVEAVNKLREEYPNVRATVTDPQPRQKQIVTEIQRDANLEAVRTVATETYAEVRQMPTPQMRRHQRG